MEKETEIIKELSDKIEDITARRMQLIVQHYFKNVLKLPCPDFTLDLKDNIYTDN